MSILSSISAFHHRILTIITTVYIIHKSTNVLYPYNSGTVSTSYKVPWLLILPKAIYNTSSFGRSTKPTDIYCVVHPIATFVFLPIPPVSNTQQQLHQVNQQLWLQRPNLTKRDTSYSCISIFPICIIH